jgi:hypothetical protein
VRPRPPTVSRPLPNVAKGSIRPPQAAFFKVALFFGFRTEGPAIYIAQPNVVTSPFIAHDLSIADY